MMTDSQNAAGQSIAEKQAAFKAMMLQKAGPVGPFAGSEDFPKSYFLIPKNLPFLVLMTLSHPIGEKLNLTDAQKKSDNGRKRNHRAKSCSRRTASQEAGA